MLGRGYEAQFRRYAGAAFSTSLIESCRVACHRFFRFRFRFRFEILVGVLARRYNWRVTESKVDSTRMYNM